jgi:GTP pyrophosphokinase
MVSRRNSGAFGSGAAFDADGWLTALAQATGMQVLSVARLLRFVRRHGLDVPCGGWGSLRNCFDAGVAVADVIAGIGADRVSLLAGLVYPLAATLGRRLPPPPVSRTVLRLLADLERVSIIDELSYDEPAMLARQARTQADNVRHMLVAMLGDARVPVVKLAERLAALAAAKAAPEERRLRMAKQAMHVLAPLAHRLGIGQLRWELEDHAFRYLQPDQYAQVARLLEATRLEREREIRAVGDEIAADLRAQGIEAQVLGRAKHIYSIWRKMQARGVGYEGIHDVRAVRIIVGDDAACYAALGAVHRRFQHVAHEFDDYIASPKANGYRSLHTAVIGPGGRILEVQIRTPEMHAEAEYGICAHWRYKEGDARRRVDAYERKLDWLRRALDWRLAGGELGAEAMAAPDAFEDELVYVHTPAGDVVDLLAGSTPVDFAYRIHTRMGHRCVGARVDGQDVPLNTRLHTGQRVEILTDPHARPRREWLQPEYGYLATSRARDQVRAYFAGENRQRNQAAGRQLLRSEMQRLGIVFAAARLARRLGYPSPAAMHEALGRGDLAFARVALAAEALARDPGRSGRLDAQPAGARLRGAGNRSVHLAACCNPRAGDAVAGLARRGTVFVHRADCPQLLAVVADRSERVLRLDWERGDERSHRVTITAFDRSGLLADIGAELARARINVVAMSLRCDDDIGTATVEMQVQSPSQAAVSRAISAIEQVANVVAVQSSTD